MNKIITTLILGIFIFSFASASISSLETQKQGECINLPQTCPDCTYNNISRVLYPNSTTALSNVAMQKDDTFYNYTFCNTISTGVYKVNGYGDVGGTKTSWNYIFEVTYDGLPSDVWSWNFILIGIGFLFIVFGLQKERYSFFQSVGSIMLFVMGVWTLYPGYSTLSWQNIQGQLLGIALIGLGFYFMIEPSFSRKEQSDKFEQDFEEDDD